MIKGTRSGDVEQSYCQKGESFTKTKGVKTPKKGSKGGKKY